MQVLGSSTRKNELALAACELIIDSWYCAYEENFGPPEIFRDAKTIVELAGGHPL